MKRLNRQSVSALLEGLVPDEIIDIRVNPRKNVMAIDDSRATALNTLRNVATLDGINVRSYIPVGSSFVSGVIYDVDAAIPSSDLCGLVKPANEATIIAKVARLVTSRCVKIDFKSNSLPSYVKVGHFRHYVRRFVPKPLQCHNCMKLGHVRTACENRRVCSRCTEAHCAEDCIANVLKCSNSNGPHEASSRECQIMKREIAVLKQMARDHTSHREAAETIRKWLRRRRGSSKKTNASASTAPLERPASLATLSTGPLAAGTNSTWPTLPKPQSHRCVTAGVNDNTKEGMDTSDAAWPSLPKSQRHAESLCTSVTVNTESIADQLPEEDKAIVIVLQSLLDTVSMIVGKLKSPYAQSVKQVLDVLRPVLASLQ
uniref:Tick transposon n=1 Tax=Rhipicephalus appendiculatus TaxID=34631 RepID=A0A131YL02_RHIAP